MKKLLLLLSLFVLMTTVTEAQEYAKMDKSAMDAAYYPQQAALRTFAKTPEEKVALTPKIRILYSRPAKKGRKVFGELLPFGEAWRIGANESTEVLFMTDVKFGGSTIKAGRYSMIAIPTAKSWVIKINTDLDGWGNYSYDPTKDIAMVSVLTQSSKETIENLSMYMYEKSANTIHLNIGWDDTFVEVPIELL